MVPTLLHSKRLVSAFTALVVAGCSSSSSAPSGVADASPEDTGADGPVVADTAPQIDCTDRGKGACQPTSAGPAVETTMVTVLGRDVYWIAAGKFLTVSLDGGDVREIAQPTDPLQVGFAQSTSIVHDATRIFTLSPPCCAATRNVLFAIEPATSTWSDVDIAGPGVMYGAAYAAGRIFVAYTTDSSQTLASWSAADYARGPDVDLPVGISDIGSDGDTIFAVANAYPKVLPPVDVLRVDGKTVTKLTSVTDLPQASGGAPAIDESSVYFYSGTKIFAADKSTPGPARVVVDLAPNHVLGLVVDATRVHWIDDAGVHSIAKSGGTPVLLAPPQPPVKWTIMLAQSSDYLVWTGASGLGKVHK